MMHGQKNVKLCNRYLLF